LGNPFVAVNCGAIPEGLVESELFGHARGAFTGATDARAGKFVEADGGTLFLDEISELPLGLQVKLLRVLQDKTVTPVGESKTRSVNTRVVTASNQDLEALVKEGKFRSDLFFRLNVVPILLPALRERAEDVAPLAHHFLASANRRSHKNITLSEAALLAMQLYSWPGNVRELENLIERMVILNRTGVIGFDDLPTGVRSPSADFAAATANMLIHRGHRPGGDLGAHRSRADRPGHAHLGREQDPRRRAAGAEPHHPAGQAEASERRIGELGHRCGSGAGSGGRIRWPETGSGAGAGSGPAAVHPDAQPTTNLRQAAPVTSAWGRCGAGRTRKCFPWPTSLSTPMRPPCASTASRQKVRPRPVENLWPRETAST
jgi:DNA-binding NtrC family response regulator